MKRRHFLRNLAAAGLLSSNASQAFAQADARLLGQDHPLWNVWVAWRNQHLDFSGRVIDVPQERASHSEGQGYGMLLAAEIGDELVFDRMAEWTQNNLAIRGDNLLAWRWFPDRPERVPDINNASDGDLFHAWALLRGSASFDRPELAERAASIAQDLVEKCVVERPDDSTQQLLLPAASGFATPSGYIFNPSYMMPLALRELGEASDQQALISAADSALSLMLELARTGPVPDWLEITPAGVREAAGFSPNAGYEALRIPIFLIWSGEGNHPAVIEYADAQRDLRFGSFGTIVSRDGGTILEPSEEAGYRAIRVLNRCQVENLDYVAVPSFDTNQPYYPATLQLFCFLVLLNAMPSCRPI